MNATLPNTVSELERARFNMVEQQIRTWEVLDPRVLELLFEVHREDFVPPAYRGLAFVDMEIPLGGSGPAAGQAMLSPKVEARIVQELALRKTESVLEIGTGSGYLTALLAKSTRHVTSVEIFHEFSSEARIKLARAGIANASLSVGDAARAQPAAIGTGKYDAIVLTGSTPVLPGGFLELLNGGGRLFAVVGDAPVMKARVYTREATGTVTHRDVFETVLAPLANAEQPERFSF